MSYEIHVPPKKITNRYGDLLVNFGLGGGEGIQPDEVVRVVCPASGLPLHGAIVDSVIRAGGIPDEKIIDDFHRTDRHFLDHATLDRIRKPQYGLAEGMIADIDHMVYIAGDNNPLRMDGVPPNKLAARHMSRRPMIEGFNRKEQVGKYSWTVGLFGTPAMAELAEMSVDEYWQEISNACYLDLPNPIERWRQVQRELGAVSAALTGLSIQEVHVVGEDVDLRVGIGSDRKWITTSGRNIPSFEVYTSPDWRRTNGWIRFNQPFSHNGPKVEGARLEYKDGNLVAASADTNEETLLEMLKTDEGASRLGEFSLTDGRHSRITRRMGHTLYDENIGGPEGNTHVAVGNAYRDAIVLDQAGLSDADYAERGYNKSIVHSDLISTTERTVTATLADGSEMVIYHRGHFSDELLAA